ncbi:40s ribosomal protein s5-1 [Hordeum vulgare]|nr:40s ribosomal protein s5-1 [Hordeum vulgare]
MKHPQAIEMSDLVLHIRDVQGPKKQGSEKARLVAVEEEIFKCQGIVEHGLSANHSMITDFIRENKLDTKSMGAFLSKIQEQLGRLQDEIYELQVQNCSTQVPFVSKGYSLRRDVTWVSKARVQALVMGPLVT